MKLCPVGNFNSRFRKREDQEPLMDTGNPFWTEEDDDAYDTNITNMVRKFWCTFIVFNFHKFLKQIILNKCMS